MRKKSIKDFRLILIVIVIVIVLIFVVVASKAANFDFNVSRNNVPGQDNIGGKASQTFQGSGISLKYPDGWTQSQTPPGFIAVFSTDRESNNDTFSENVNIKSVDVSSQPDLTVKEVANLWLSQSQADYAAEDFNLLETNPTTLGGVPAVQFVYNIKDGDINGKGMTVVNIKDGSSYIISFTAENNTSYSKFIDEVNSIFSSFQIN